MPRSVSCRFMTVLSFCVAVFCAGTAFSQVLVPGHTPGEFSVTPSGAATYSIPIQVPPGVAGLAPSLSLNYNSQGGNDIAGLGWSLEGGSVVSRCPLTRAVDAAHGSVNFNAADRFCLDGQRLLVVSGAYGAAGSEYRTEMDQFSRIVANGAVGGSAANGPESFTVSTKDGRVLQYGATTDSRNKILGSSVVRAWGLSSIADVKGNTIGFGYLVDPNEVGWRLGAISYGAGTRSVELIHEARPDIYWGYEAGARDTIPSRLKRIDTRIGGVLVKSLNLAYDTTSNQFGSRLKSVQLCDKDNKCLAPSVFNWQSAGSDAFSSAFYTSHGGGKDNNITADFNGDGRSDMMGYAGSGSWHACLSAGTASSPSFNCTFWAGPAVGTTAVVNGDYNGDGRADIAAYTGTADKWHVCLSTGSNFSCDYWYSHSGGVSNNVGGDFNGDGRTDMASYSGAGGIWRMCLSTGAGFSCSNWTSHSGGAGNNLTADFNGDGLADMARYTGSGATWQVCLSNGAGFNCSNMSSHTGGVAKTALGDFNGDGLQDMAAFLGTPGSGTAPWQICLSTGVNFSCSDWTAHNTGLAGATGDFNGDGRTDLAAYNHSLGQWRMCLSIGTDFSCSMWSGAGPNEAQGDYNGDGIDDFAAYTGANGNWRLSFSLKNEHPLIESIVRGSVSTAIEYQGMARAGQTVYTKEATAVYPYVDIQTPMSLVRRTTMSNGVGGVNASVYSYGGMRAEHAAVAGRGRGNQGFRWTRILEETTQMESHTWYAQDWPYTGQSILSETRRAGAQGPYGTLKRTATVFDCYQTMGATPTAPCTAGASGLMYHVFPRTVTETSWDYSGAALPTVETTRELVGTMLVGGAVRQLGDITQLRVETFYGGRSRQKKVTVNEYHPAKTAGALWQIGRLKKATVTSTSYEVTPTTSGAVSYSSGSNPLGLPLTPAEIADLIPKYLMFFLNDD